MKILQHLAQLFHPKHQLTFLKENSSGKIILQITSRNIIHHCENPFLQLEEIIHLGQIHMMKAFQNIRLNPAVHQICNFVLDLFYNNLLLKVFMIMRDYTVPQTTATQRPDNRYIPLMQSPSLMVIPSLIHPYHRCSDIYTKCLENCIQILLRKIKNDLLAVFSFSVIILLLASLPVHRQIWPSKNPYRLQLAAEENLLYILLPPVPLLIHRSPSPVDIQIADRETSRVEIQHSACRHIAPALGCPRPENGYHHQNQNAAADPVQPRKSLHQHPENSKQRQQHGTDY